MNKNEKLLSIGLILCLIFVVLIAIPIPIPQSSTSIVKAASVRTDSYQMRRWKVIEPTTTTSTTTTTIDPIWTTPPEEVHRSVGGPAEAEIGGCIRMYESGGTTDTEGSNSHQDGYYQIIPSTWDDYKGYEIAQNAPRWVQDERFNQLWEENGHAHWLAQKGRCF